MSTIISHWITTKKRKKKENNNEKCTFFRPMYQKPLNQYPEWVDKSFIRIHKKKKKTTYLSNTWQMAAETYERTNCFLNGRYRKMIEWVLFCFYTEPNLHLFLTLSGCGQAARSWLSSSRRTIVAGDDRGR